MTATARKAAKKRKEVKPVTRLPSRTSSVSQRSGYEDILT